MSGGAQTPWESSSLTGNFIFNAPVNVTIQQAPPTPATPMPSPAVEVAFWQSIQNSKNPAMFEEYLRKYPNGAFAGLARINLDALKQQARAPQPAASPPAAPRVKAKPRPQAKPKPQPRVVPAFSPNSRESLRDAARRVQRYYDTRGRWAGQFRLARVLRIRIDPARNGEYRAQVRYAFQCVASCSQPDGEDQRWFRMRRSDDERHWIVMQMGGHMSARF